ncbi:hypothetical protein [Coleofasciculus sp. E1-EBD-02]|uniref:hypothetical protein n=1 Tax=Coleofasciculus sp. E1-EBD-02 TaxID=3068481 RepID=UPI0032F61186
MIGARVEVYLYCIVVTQLAIALPHPQASIPDDMGDLGNGKTRSHPGDRESAIAWESRYL